LTFEPSEIHKIGPGIPSGVQTAVSSMSVIMPKAPEDVELVTKLKAIFQGARSGEVKIIDSDDRPNEIVIISLTNLFPMRYVRQVGFLKQQYDLRISGSPDRAKLELHLEGDGTQHPRIFVPAQEELKRDAIPCLLLAKSLNMLQQAAAPQSGAMELLFVAKDENGFDTDPIHLGKAFSDSPDQLDHTGADLIKKYVEGMLSTKENALETKRGELQKLVVPEVDAIKAERGNNIQDDVYRRFLEGGKCAVKILRREE
jgi:hypothetical protein